MREQQRAGEAASTSASTFAPRSAATLFGLPFEWWMGEFGIEDEGPDEESSQTPHHHQCKGCGVVWKHDPRPLIAGMQSGDIARMKQAQEEYQRSHACPRCGKDERRISGAKLVAEFCHNGRRTVKLKDGKVVEPAPPRMDGETALELEEMDPRGLVKSDSARQFIRELEKLLFGEES